MPIDARVRILQGDVVDQLRSLPDESVDCVVTSPPYWGLRDYGTGKWAGGDSQCLHSPHNTPTKRGLNSSTLGGGKNHTGHKHEAYKSTCAMCGAVRVEDNQIGLEADIPAHMAALIAVFAEVRRVLKKDGTCWVNYGDAYATTVNGRSAAKVSEIGHDNRTFRDKPFSTVTGSLKAKQRLMLPARLALALQEDGWWLRDEIVWHKPNPMPSSVRDRTTMAHEMLYMFTKSPRYYYNAEAIAEGAAVGAKGSRFDVGKTAEARPHAQSGERRLYSQRNKRSVWTISTEAYAEAHFATFPTSLVAPCIMAGCRPGGVVLDPFAGSGTTGYVAARLGRRAVLVELNGRYVDLIRQRMGYAGIAESEVAYG